ncbi:unnamed protein product [Prorocentrum cordatum]|uniref:Uncharacterized protein n=1 Tax=Prorocentrum cordatum TaxID=2364126 RepID=A0ABN9UK75_9DINO|nr:unnamed protein product [Polarella glacialis]
MGRDPRPVTLATWVRARRRLQASATTLLRRQHWLRAGHAQLSAKVRKWHDPGSLPGRRAERCRLVMQRLPQKTPPRVRAAVLRTWLNGWCAGRRFGARGGRCAFGCRLGDDDVRHYVCCPKLWRFGVSKLGLADPGPPAERTTRALLWQPGDGHDGKAHTTLRHAAGARLNVPRLFAEVLSQLQEPRVAAGSAIHGV